MPISVTCDCGRAYQIASKHAGKKFRCKECGDTVHIPAVSRKRAVQKPKREHPDDFGATDFEDYDSDDDFAPVPPQPRKRKSPAKKPRQSTRTGMPLTVMFAIFCEVVLIVINSLITGLYLGFGLIFAEEFRSRQDPGFVVGVSLIGVLRIVIEYFLIQGMRRRESQARWLAIGLSVMGLLFFGLVLAVIVAKNGFFRHPMIEDSDVWAFVFLVQVSLNFVETVMLLLPPSGRYFKS